MAQKVGIVSFFTLLVLMLSRVSPAPVWNLFLVWLFIIWVGTLIKWLFGAVFPKPEPVYTLDANLNLVRARDAFPVRAANWISRAWDIFQTFVFITFTRLFFRSGSNLDPALANEQAWNTAKNMVNQIGSAWDLSKVPAMAWEHRAVLIVFVVGMLIHWLPERFKRRYRLAFSRLPLGVMGVVVVLLVLFIYQFITADLQSFIYFQF